MNDLELFGLSEETITKLKDVFIKWNAIDTVIIYGSRAKGNYREGSDIDLTITGNLSLTDLLKIENEIDDLMLIYKFDISLMGQIENESLISHIQRVGKIFYARGASTRCQQTCAKKGTQNVFKT